MMKCNDLVTICFYPEYIKYLFSKKISLVYSSVMMDPHHILRLAQQLLQLDADQNNVVQQKQQALRRQRRGARHR